MMKVQVFLVCPNCDTKVQVFADVSKKGKIKDPVSPEGWKDKLYHETPTCQGEWVPHCPNCL